MGNNRSTLGTCSPVGDPSDRENDPSTNFVPKLVVAIDFGTYNSGYAYQRRSDYEKERTKSINLSKWQGPGMETHKTPTCILLKPDTSIESFGYDAQDQFSILKLVKDDYSKWFYFSFFKMMLYHEQDLSEETRLESAFGRTLPAICVFSKAIEYMKNHFIDQFSTNAGNKYEENETLWVLTVPAIWNDKAKQFMRKAAEKAGILRDRLVLALEPEAAAIFCCQISTNQMEIQGTDGKPVAAPGSTVMVVDLGGGTVDTTIVEVGMDGTMKQVYEANGDDSGGMKVNEKFTLLMQEITGLSVWNKFITNCKQDEHELQMEIELKKRGIRMTNEKSMIIIKIPQTLIDIWEKQTGRRVEESLSMLEGRLHGKVNISSEKLIFDISLLVEFFLDPVSDILDAVKDVHKLSSQAGSLSGLILVGGFSQSDLVTTRVRDGLADLQIPVFRPDSPEVAVLKGACLFGFIPDIITSRVIRRTYGVGMNVDFISGKHDENVKFKALDGKFYAMNVFKKHIERGQELKINEWTKAVDYCVDEQQETSTDVFIYASEDKDPNYTDGCMYVGKLSVIFNDNGNPRPNTRRSKSIEVSLCFAGNELKVRAVDKNTRCEYETILQLL